MAEASGAKATNPAAILVLIVAVQLIAAIDFGAISVALPAIGRALALPPVKLHWVVSATLLASGSLLIFAGRLLDFFGPRRCVLAGLIIYAAGSAAASQAQDAGLLIAGRAACGVANALLQTSMMSVAITMFEGRQRHLALSLFAMTQTIGAGLGVMLGGYLTTNHGWQVNPALIAGYVCIVFLMALSVAPVGVTKPLRLRSLNLPGVIVVTASLALLLLAVGMAARADADPLATAGSFAVALCGLMAFSRIERHTSDPLIPPGLFRSPNFLGLILAVCFATASSSGIFYLLGLYMQDVARHSPTVTGYVFLPKILAAVLYTFLAPRLLKDRRPQVNIVIGLMLLAGDYALLLLLPVAPVPVAICATALQPLAIVFTIVTATNAAIASIPAQNRGVGSALVLAAQSIASATGMAIYGAVLQMADTANGGSVIAGMISAMLIALVGIPLTLSLVRVGRIQAVPAG